MDKTTTTRYNQAPKFHGKGRTKFDLSHNILTTFNTGDLVPILVEPIVPGSTFSLKTATLARLETSFHQTMDNAYLEFAYFFVPSRILWSHFGEYQGYNADAWARQTTYTKPQYCLAHAANTTNTDVKPMSLINYIYSPATETPIVDFSTGQLNVDFNAVDLLPLRAVYKIYNEYFRDENIDSEIAFSDGDNWENVNTGYLFNGSYFYPSQNTLKVNRFKDQFSTALPQPQKGSPIQLLANLSAPIGLLNNGTGSLQAGNTVTTHALANTAVDNVAFLGGANANAGINTPSPLFADLNKVNFTVNDLRIAIALQSMRERDARSGTRLNEKLFGTWHIECNSLELDKPEFLGGKRIPVSMMEVLQTSETGTTVLGSDAGHSKTFDADDSFVRTFTQWGYVIGFVFVRTSRSYSQGIDRKFFVENIMDEYDPMLDNIGEMPVFKKELNACFDGYAQNSVSKSNQVFGYQEAWYWLKERNNRFSGMFQPHINGTLDSWHYGDNYVYPYLPGPGQSSVLAYDAPLLSPEWLKESPDQVDRTIAVVSGGSSGAFQWSINVHFEAYNTFEASYRSVPNKFGF